MEEALSVVFTGLLAFVALHYTLAVAAVKEPLNSVISAVFAILLVVLVGVLGLTDVVN